MSQREAQLQEQLRVAQQEITLLKAKIDALCRCLYGVKSEKFNPAQLELLLLHIEAGKVLASPEPTASSGDSGRPTPKRQHAGARSASLACPRTCQ